MATENSRDILTRYFEDAIAAERTFEDQLRAFANSGDQEEAHELFRTHADETKTQYERLETRLRALGGTPSAIKSALAHMFAFAPATAQMGHEPAEKDTQHLMMAYAVENAEMAMYEAFAIAAQESGDMETVRLARQIQTEERRTADRVWAMLPSASRRAFDRVTA
jgi:ferritin-like metal-binding protein YciE